MKFIIGSFNMCNLSFKSDKDTKKNYEKIANIIKDEQFDIVAMQEVLTPNVIKDCIMPVLGPYWHYRWDSPEIGSSLGIKSITMAAKGYVFLWNKKKIKLAPTENGEFEPRIFDRYKLKSGQMDLLRKPYYAKFVPVMNIPVEFRLVNAHIIYGEGFGAIERRRNEFGILTETILNKLSNEVYEAYTTGNNKNSNRVRYTVLLGDYNLNIKKDGLVLDQNPGPYLDKKVVISYKNKTANAVTVQDKLTTLNQDNTSYSSNFDHFSYNDENFEGVKIEWNRIDAVQKYFDNDFEQYKKQVSDHLPVKLTIDLRNGR